MSQSIYNPVTKQLETFAGNQEAIAARLDGLADVVAPNPSNGDLLKYDAANEEWIPSAKPSYTPSEVGTYSKDEIDELFAEHENNISWKTAVPTYNDIATTYPNPQEGWTVCCTDTNIVWRYSGGQWVKISANTIPEASASVAGLLSTDNFTKLSGIAAGAQVNQNAFSQIKIGNTTIAADNATDVLELVAGTKITLTPDTTNDKITISADAEPYQVMSSSEMSTGTSETARSMTAKNLKTGLKTLLLELVYPVGSFYISTKNVSPATFLGGTWAARSGYVLRAASSGVTFNTNNATGGADSVSYTPAGSTSGLVLNGTAITEAQMPAHTHTMGMGLDGGIVGGHIWEATNSTNRTWYFASTGYGAGTTGSKGSSQAHTHSVKTNATFTGTAATINTLPKYRSVYMWERTA